MKPAAAVGIVKRPDGQVVPVKAGFFGGQGSGKSYTAAMLALAIAKELHDGAPVYVYDTEPGWQFFRKIFKLEGVELIQEVGNTFDGCERAHEKALKGGCCVFVGDSYTHIWLDLMRGYMSEAGFVEFQDWNKIKPTWRDWTVAFLNSPMHCFALGRLGWNYLPQPNERRGGKIEMVRSDSKFNAGGNESFGYEPHLLFEMEVGRKGARAGRGGQFIYLANVLKDRAQVLNGAQFTFEGARGYQKRDYITVWNAVAPHFQAMQELEGMPLIPPGTHEGAYQVNPEGYSKQREQRKILLETIENSLTLLWPGLDQKSKRFKLRVVEQVFGVRAWSAVEVKPLPELQFGSDVLYALEKRMTPGSEGGVYVAPEIADEGQLATFVAEVIADAKKPCSVRCKVPETINELILKKPAAKDEDLVPVLEESVRQAKAKRAQN